MEFTKQKHVGWRKINKPMKGVEKKGMMVYQQGL